MLRGTPSWVIGWQETPAGKIPRISTKLKFRDLLGFWRMRWRIGRMSYKVEPGLYAVGNPNSQAPVLVSANYKMSFDILRHAVEGYNLWILALDTKGINVWCAAGKGTFSAEEILRRIKESRLGEILSKKVLILPQLSATGVKAYEVQKHSGFQVVYGPVRASDLPAFLEEGMKASPEMRRVKFNLMDRLVLTPAELVWSLKWVIPLLALLFFLGGFHGFGFSAIQAWKVFSSASLALIGAVLTGTVATPVLLPWIPGRAFSLKGCLLGLIWALALLAYRQYSLSPGNLADIPETLSILLLMPAISAFFALNFTGSTTFTSVSGVRRELKFALPAITGSAIIGAALFITGLIIAQLK